MDQQEQTAEVAQGFVVGSARCDIDDLTLPDDISLSGDELDGDGKYTYERNNTGDWKYTNECNNIGGAYSTRNRYDPARYDANRRNIYSESWKASRNYTKHMWRFYFAKQNITIDQMSAASRNAWIACNTAYSRLDRAEQNIAQIYFSAEHGTEKDVITEYSVNYNEPEWSVYKVINKALRLAAIERGIADE